MASRKSTRKEGNGNDEYPHEMSGKELRLPSEIKDFFGKKGIYLQVHRKKDQLRIPLTYEAVEGGDPSDIPSEYSNDPHLLASTEEYPIINSEERLHTRADQVGLRVLKVFGYDVNLNHTIRRAFMINTSTLPIRISAVDSSRKQVAAYAKKPDENRILGWFLYTLMSGRFRNQFAFNERIFMENELPANPLSRLNEKIYLSIPKYREGVVRAAVYVGLLGFGNDIVMPRNRLVDSDKGTILFDFNILFQPRINPSDNPLIESYMSVPGFTDDNVLDAYFDEQKRILRNIESDHKEFFKFCKIAGSLGDLTGQSVDDRVRRYYGAMTLEKYFEDKMDEFRKS